MGHEYEKYWEHNGCRVIECQSCGFRHIYPIPEESQIKEFYKEKYYSEVKPFDYATVSSDSIREKSEAVYKNTGYQAIYDKVMELKLSQNREMVDIGCGNDLLALYFKHNGWKAYVIEPNIMAAQYLGQFGLSVINDYIENILPNKFEGISFINLQFVLEHLKDPASFLKKAYGLLVPGGIIRICVPNDFSEGQLAFQEYYNEACRWIAFPDHINYFSFDSLNTLLLRTGFEELYRTTSFPLEFLLLGGTNYYAEEKHKKYIGAFVKNFESSLRGTGRKNLLNRLYEELSEIGMGRSIYMYAIKKSGKR